MSRKQKYLDYDDYFGAVAVMENFLDGAVADYEQGDVENTALIEGCINAIKLIYAMCNPWLLLGGNEYEKRMNDAKARQVSKQ